MKNRKVCIASVSKVGVIPAALEQEAGRLSAAEGARTGQGGSPSAAGQPAVQTWVLFMFKLCLERAAEIRYCPKILIISHP